MNEGRTLLRYERCPNCAIEGGSVTTDSKSVYSDGSEKCVKCGYRNILQHKVTQGDINEIYAEIVKLNYEVHYAKREIQNLFNSLDKFSSRIRDKIRGIFSNDEDSNK